MTSADVAHGMPAAQLGVPTDRSFAATLLILREVLHHGGFAFVEIVLGARAQKR